ncbi:Sec-independent protein translocase protein TatC [Planctomycetia bacterium]|nr:Sec-independent protein translocase protein TatC [Planctomycetia bacterium]
MSRKRSKDLFDDTTMTFGEHLEELRVRMWRAIVGLTLVTGVTMYFGDQVMAVVRKPIEDALRSRQVLASEDAKPFDASQTWNDFWDWIRGRSIATPETPPEVITDLKTVTVQIKPYDLLTALHEAAPERFPAPEPKPVPAATSAPSATKDTAIPAEAKEKTVSLRLTASEIAEWRRAAEQDLRPVVLTVQEGFMTWLKVSFVAGLVLSSPWVFYQMWLFVAAGLYPHEQKYIHIYLPMSLGLFLGGAAFCFYCVFPFVLGFLLQFADDLGFQTQIRIADWIDFAIMLPLMFGISFQLPLVMLFLERLSIFEIKDYQEKRRIAIFVITVVSMILTPAEPYSMLMMMIPMILLYEVGILICRWFPKPKPFDDEEDEKKTAIATT